MSSAPSSCARSLQRWRGRPPLGRAMRHCTTATLPRPGRALLARDDCSLMSTTRTLLGGVELGGTKCICLLGTSPEDIRAQLTIPTGHEPGVTLRAIVA